MAMYYFNLNDHDTVVDIDGTDLPDLGAARIHATAWANFFVAASMDGTLQRA